MGCGADNREAAAEWGSAVCRSTRDCAHPRPAHRRRHDRWAPQCGLGLLGGRLSPSRGACWGAVAAPGACCSWQLTSLLLLLLPPLLQGTWCGQTTGAGTQEQGRGRTGAQNGWNIICLLWLAGCRQLRCIKDKQQGQRSPAHALDPPGRPRPGLPVPLNLLAGRLLHLAALLLHRCWSSTQHAHCQHCCAPGREIASRSEEAGGCGSTAKQAGAIRSLTLRTMAAWNSSF